MLIRTTNDKASGYKQMQTTREMQNGCPNQANMPKIKNERTHGEEEGEKREKTTRTLSEKKVEASNVSEQWDKDWIHVIRVHDTTHVAVTTWQGNRHS